MDFLYVSLVSSKYLITKLTILKQESVNRSKAVLVLWFLTVTCSCCPYLYFGSAIMLVTYFSKF